MEIGNKKGKHDCCLCITRVRLLLKSEPGMIRRSDGGWIERGLCRAMERYYRSVKPVLWWESNKRERFDGRAETVIVSLDELRTMGEQRSWIYRNKEGEKNKKVKIPRGQFRRIILQSYTHKQMVLLLMVYETYTYEFKTVAKSLRWYMAIFL
jgi:hypothetical protein